MLLNIMLSICEGVTQCLQTLCTVTIFTSLQLYVVPRRLQYIYIYIGGPNWSNRRLRIDYTFKANMSCISGYWQ